MAWPNVYTYNFCPNPSFEFDLSGVVALAGASISIDPGTGLYGQRSLVVTTPGQAVNEGVQLAPGTVLASGTGCVSFWLQGNDVTSTGTLTAQVIDTTTSTVLGSTQVVFSPATGWTQYVINNVNLVNTDTIALFIQTTTTQQVAFNVDGIQYEPSLSGSNGNAGALPTPYCDGDQQFCSWIGAIGSSASQKVYQNQLGASGTIITSGYGSLLIQGAVFFLSNQDPASGPALVQGNIDLSGQQFQGLTGLLSGGGIVTVAGTTAALMASGIDDFALFIAGDVDPAIALVGYNNTGVSTGTNTAGSAGYTRPYATFSTPIAFQGSTGKNIWNTASYFALGYQFGSMVNNSAQNVTHAQAELVPGAGVPVVPSAYIRPRALTAKVAPTRLNYVTNPSFEVATGNSSLGISDGTFESGVAGWTAFGATVASSSAQFHSGAKSALVTSTVSGGGTQAYLRSQQVHVVPGYSYSATVWVFSNTASNTYTGTIDWFDVNNVYISSSAATSTTPAISTWTQYVATGTAPSNAAWASYGPTCINPTAVGANYNTDDITFVINSTVLAWRADTASTLTQSLFQGGAVTGSSWSAKVVTTAVNNGIYIPVPNLIVGQTYTASAYVQNTSNASPNTGKISVGAVNATVSMPQNTWVRVSVTFTAVNSNVLLDIQTATAGTFLVDAVMLELGSVLNAYSDGSFTYWGWEDPTQPGLTRSYFYKRGGIAYAALQQILASHLPLGLKAYDPVFFSPPTQYS